MLNGEGKMRNVSKMSILGEGREGRGEVKGGVR